MTTAKEMHSTAAHRSVHRTTVASDRNTGTLAWIRRQAGRFYRYGLDFLRGRVGTAGRVRVPCGRDTRNSDVTGPSNLRPIGTIRKLQLEDDQ
jgi:hypothetical protein